MLIDVKMPNMIRAIVYVNDRVKAHIGGLKSSIPWNRDYILSSDILEGIY
jgi:hypothetical protein